MYELNPIEIRIIGVLFEKERATPEQYPLSLNALVTGCNQKSSRDPVMALSESEVQQAVDGLLEKSLMTEVIVGSRVKKYKQRFGNTEFSALQLNRKEQAIICLLFLRGPQTAGELRTRSNRLVEFSGIDDVETSLLSLQQRDTPNVQKLEREPGKRECRYRHLFSAHEQNETQEQLSSTLTDEEKHMADTRIPAAAPSKLEARVAELELQVSTMQQELTEIKAIWQSLNE